MPIERSLTQPCLHVLPPKVTNRVPRAVEYDRRDGMEPLSVRRGIDEMIDLALTGLPRMHKAGAFGHTLRAVKSKSLDTEELEGDSLRYTAIVALGLAFLPLDEQFSALAGMSASELGRVCASRARTSSDPGAIALAAWAAAEASEFYAQALFDRLADHLTSEDAVETVTCAWALTAAIAAARLGDTRNIKSLATDLLLKGQSRHGLFPHILSSGKAGYVRAHIGCFADQVYPIQALSRLHATCATPGALAAAQAVATRICALQGSAGQWWWHYDTRDGSVVEGYPVYSVHQHGMAPMVLLDLKEAGGKDHLSSIRKGLEWLFQRPELPTRLIENDKGVIWRKVARREPGKMVRWLSAMTTAASPGLRLPGLDLLFPPRLIDHECRPYELGWLLYAWLSGGTVTRLAAGKTATHDRTSGGTT